MTIASISTDEPPPVVSDPQRGGAPSDGVTHIVGAGLAGLAAAVRLSGDGRRVRLYEATQHAGGRCRSFHDRTLGRMIDNGNHLVLSGNHSARAYLNEIGGEGALVAAAEAALPFVDVASGRRWRLSMNDSRAPWWLLSPSRRVADTRVSDYFSGVRLAFAKPEATVADAITTRGPIWSRLWEPLTLAVLNAPPERASAQLIWAVLRETFVRGGAYCKPMLAPEGLGAALVDPALALLKKRGVEIVYGAALKDVEAIDARAQKLRFGDEDVALGPEDAVILALPPSRLRAVIPTIEPPSDLSPIVNAHFALKNPALLADAPPILGVIGATTQWIFVRDGVASVTISAANAIGVSETPSDVLIPTLWAETRTALGLPADAELAGARILREKRATFDQSPDGVKKRPSQRTNIQNLVLAGDATNTGLPATIEGAIRSGHHAAALLVERAGQAVSRKLH